MVGGIGVVVMVYIHGVGLRMTRVACPSDPQAHSMAVHEEAEGEGDCKCFESTGAQYVPLPIANP